MANYQVVDADKLDSDLTVVADAIRERAGTSAKMVFPDGFADAVRNIQTGDASDGGLVVKSGNTAEQTFDTGLSSISYLVLYKKTHTDTGLMEGFFAKDFCRYVYCGSYSEYLKTASFGTSTSNYSFDGGTFTFSATGTLGFSSGETYYWYAFGTE